MDYYGDDHLYTLDWVFALLGSPAALAHPKWADLVAATIKAKQAAVGDWSACDVEIKALFETAAAKEHKKYATLLAAAKKACPYAGLPALPTAAG